MQMLRRALNLFVVAILVLSLCRPLPARAQQDPEQLIPKIVSQMTPEAKVGQLFVVAFSGTNTASTSDIADLIMNYHVGGVMLSTANGNIVNSANTPTQTATLISSLQSLARLSANIPSASGRTLPFIPLFVALEQNGNGAPSSQLTGGFTPLPSPMAIGATWKREDAANVGKLVGAELAAVGVNLLLGPSLDVLDEPRTGDAGVNAFGGDPYWVGVMGQSYARGLREGSQSRVAAVLTHFPGQGSLAESSDEVDRSLEQLKKVELVPFLSMLQPAAGETRALADALMTSHVRYRSFSGNIRERTAPMSVDAKAMQQLLALPEVKAWRDAGGVLVSGSLGAPFVRRYYDPLLLTFPAQRAALDALQAGNDLLLLTDLSASGSWLEQASSAKSVIKFFQEKYSTDLNFQARVDDAVVRILRLKVRQYPGFDPVSVIVTASTATAAVGWSSAVTQQVAQDALTWLMPTPFSLTDKLVPTPTAQDSLLIFTDDRTHKECTACPSRPLVISDTLQQTLVRLYAGKVDPARITSLGLSSLQAYLNPTTPATPGPDVVAALGAANWIVFVVLNMDAAVPQSNALKQLVTQRANLLTNKKVAILSLDAPYQLDADVLAKATVAYALYGRTPPFIEVAARALMGDVRPPGNPPVDVAAIRYRLITQTEPNPGQVIPIYVGDEPKETVTPVPPQLKVGDTLKVRTGVILDRNGHPVPDGTQVTFTRTFSQSSELPSLFAATRNGVATVSFPLDRIGPLRVRAASEPAMTSYVLQLAVAEQPSAPTIIAPPTPTPLPTSTWTPTPLPTPTPTPSPTPVVVASTLRKSYWVEPKDFALAVIGVVVAGAAGFGVQFLRRRKSEDEADAIARAVRWGLWSIAAGLIGYILYGLGAPGSLTVRAVLGTWSALGVAILFGAAPIVSCLLWPIYRRWQLTNVNK